MVDKKWVREEIREALKEMVRAAQMRVQHDTSMVEDKASKAVEDCAHATLKEREAVWAAEEREEASAPAGSKSGACRCRPWTMVGGRGRYLAPGDDPGRVTGWDRSGGCPVHPLEGKPTCGALDLYGTQRCTLVVHGPETRHGNELSSWPNRDKVAGAAASVAFAVDVEVNMAAFRELLKEEATPDSVAMLVRGLLASSLVVKNVRKPIG